ncbi:MAG: hypothetical protein JKY62_16165 [Desulfocapsa sp.]|jgi:hypothetical protein|nr:hypothetical protein [Desulfocapsa sp.]MBN4060112.1 hypothetical protein [Desulfotalea psychrophila]
MSEHQTMEYKQTWRSECLNWICGFANAQGCYLTGILVDVDLHQQDGLEDLEQWASAR